LSPSLSPRFYPPLPRVALVANGRAAREEREERVSEERGEERRGEERREASKESGTPIIQT